MPITVPMIEDKEFKIQFRGYDPAEVDEFLDEICDEMITMQEEISRLQAQLAQTKRDLAYVQPAAQRPAPAPAVAPTPAVTDVSESAQKLMANAQRLCEETIAQAKQEAAEIIAKAQDTVSQDLKNEKAELEQEISDLRATALSYRQKILSLTEELRSTLDKADLE